MDPCPFVRIVIGNLALKFPAKTQLDSISYYCRFKLKGFPVQFSDVSLTGPENEAVERRIHACFALKRSQLEKLAEKSRKLYCLKVEIRRRSHRGSRVCRFVNGGKLLGCVVVQLDLKSILENLGSNCNRTCVVQNGWVSVGRADTKLHINVRAEPDPRFVFRFDGDPECSPQVFQVNGNVKQPVFTCKFGFRNTGDRVLRSRSTVSEPTTSSSCFTPVKSKTDERCPTRERKGWSITIHDLQGSPVAAASMVTPFVPSPGSNRVSRSSPGAWLILRPGQGTWQPWGRLEAWRDGPRLGYRFDLVPDGIDTVPLASSAVDARAGGKMSIDVTTGPTPPASPGSSFDLGSGSSSEMGSVSGSGSWAHLLYRGFVMSSTVVERGGPEVEVGAPHVTCAEDAAVFVALAAAMDLSMDACRSF